MDSVRKYEIKQWLKKKKKWFIVSGGFAVLGIIFLIIGMVVAKVDIVKMFTQPFAITCYVFVGIGIVVLILMWFVDFMGKKGR